MRSDSRRATEAIKARPSRGSSMASSSSALAVTTGKRSSALPEVPTLAESGLKGFDTGTWFGVLAPVAARMGKLQIYPRALTPAEVQALSQSSLFAP